VSLDGCSRAMNVDSLPQSSYPSSPLKDRDSTLTGLHHKLNSLKQGDNSIETYYHNLKFHIMRCGLEECEEATKNIFLRGLNTEIQDMLLHETYNSHTCLVELASKIQ
jgi:hypothetical protein